MRPSISYVVPPKHGATTPFVQACTRNMSLSFLHTNCERFKMSLYADDVAVFINPHKARQYNDQAYPAIIWRGNRSDRQHEQD
jgi:hypothetical protein